jgi:hypothetical protein
LEEQQILFKDTTIKLADGHQSHFSKQYELKFDFLLAFNFLMQREHMLLSEYYSVNKNLLYPHRNKKDEFLFDSQLA